MGTDNDQITGLIQAVIAGDEKHQSDVDLVYAELHRIASKAMRAERSDHTLQPTALVNEAYMRLAGKEGLVIKDRGHFFAVATTVMRRILVDHARGKKAIRRGGDLVRVTLEDAASQGHNMELLALDEQLSLLAQIDKRQASLLEMRYFGGLSIEEICEAVNMASSTVHKELKKARAWLFTRLKQG